MITPTIAARRKKDRYKQIYNLKKKMDLLKDAKTHTILSSKQQFKKKRKIAAADPSPPPIFSKTDLQHKSQQQQGSRIGSEPSWSSGERSRARGGLAIVVVRRQPVEYLVFLEPR